jgi:hypothetical protein
MIKQKWSVTIDGAEHIVEYTCSPLSGKTVLIVDDDSYTVKGKPFGIGIVRNEMILIGDTQGILSVKKGGKAELVCRDGEVEEI